tara:strand:- start:130 stop:327 length:198 start_codon:yes stop_codon:yes gene_type:complete
MKKIYRAKGITVRVMQQDLGAEWRKSMRSFLMDWIEKATEEPTPVAIKGVADDAATKEKNNTDCA